MSSTFTPNRWFRTAVKATTVVAALIAVSVTGPVSAEAATAAHTRSTTATDSAVLVKEVKNDNGVLDVYRVTGARVQPNSVTSGCAGSSLRVCLNIAGSGLYVQMMENYTTFPSAGTVNMQINGPYGVITESGNFYESGGDYVFHWMPYSYVAAGYYCATSFTYTSRQGACLTVHS